MLLAKKGGDEISKGNGHKPTQYSPYKKWTQLSLAQREYVLEEAERQYTIHRNELKRPLTIQEMKKLNNTMKLRCWIPPKNRWDKVLSSFQRSENKILKLETTKATKINS